MRNYSSFYYLGNSTGSVIGLGLDSSVKPVYYSRTVNDEPEVAKVFVTSGNIGGTSYKIQISESLKLTKDGRFIHTLNYLNLGSTTLTNMRFGVLLDTNLNMNDKVSIKADGNNGAYISAYGFTLYIDPITNSKLYATDFANQQSQDLKSSYSLSISQSELKEATKVLPDTVLKSATDSTILYEVKDLTTLKSNNFVSMQFAEQLLSGADKPVVPKTVTAKVKIPNNTSTEIWSADTYTGVVGDYVSVKVPDVTGWTHDKTTIQGIINADGTITAVDPKPSNVATGTTGGKDFVTYSAGYNITIIDDDTGKTLDDRAKTGVPGVKLSQAVDLATIFAQGYELVATKTDTNLGFTKTATGYTVNYIGTPNADNSNNAVIHVKKTPVRKTVTAKVKIPNNTTLEILSTDTYTGYVGDKVTVKVPDIAGWTKDKTTIQAIINDDGTITAVDPKPPVAAGNTPGGADFVTYSTNYNITIIDDDTGKTLEDRAKTGAPGVKLNLPVDLAAIFAQGYELVATKTDTNLGFTKTTTGYTVNYIGMPNADLTDNAVIHVKKTPVRKTVTAKVKIPNNTTVEIWTTDTYTGYVGDKVTVKVPDVTGWTKDKTTIQAIINDDGTITAVDPKPSVVASGTPGGADFVSYSTLYKVTVINDDDDGSTLDSSTQDGTPGVKEHRAIALDPLFAQGFELVATKTDPNLEFKKTATGYEVYYIGIPNADATDDAVINVKTTPKEITTKETKTITRIISYVVDPSIQGSIALPANPAPQVVVMTRDVTKDKDGKTIRTGDWTADNPNAMPEIDTPEVPGMTRDKEVISSINLTSRDQLLRLANGPATIEEQVTYTLVAIDLDLPIAGDKTKIIALAVTPLISLLAIAYFMHKRRKANEKDLDDLRKIK